MIDINVLYLFEQRRLAELPIQCRKFLEVIIAPLMESLLLGNDLNVGLVRE